VFSDVQGGTFKPIYLNGGGGGFMKFCLYFLNFSLIR
jgi:hypothetical protein